MIICTCINVFPFDINYSKQCIYSVVYNKNNPAETIKYIFIRVLESSVPYFSYFLCRFIFKLNKITLHRNLKIIDVYSLIIY